MPRIKEPPPLLQRICWNSNNWRGPSGDLYGKEESYVGDNGFGHEEWNFNANDLLNDVVYGYAYYNPPAHSLLTSHRTDVYFFAIAPTGQRVLVGRYKNARFLSKKERVKLKSSFSKSLLLLKRIEELLSLDLPNIQSVSQAKKLLLQEYSTNIEVAPQDIQVFNPPLLLTSAFTGGTDPKFLTRYTKPKFLPLSSVVPGKKITGLLDEEGESDRDLLDDAYTRRTKAQVKVIKRLHPALSNAFRKWLRKVGANNVEAEENAVDVFCKFKESSYLFELKICFQQKTRHALREALGQILEYAYYPNRKLPTFLAIVLDCEPSETDVKWFSHLHKSSIPVEIYWLAGTMIRSARITTQPLASLAAVSHRP